MYQLGENFKYTCKVCQEKFCFPTMYQDHLNMHTNNKPYRCKCKRTFDTMFNLSFHQRFCRIFHKEEGWRCTLCKIHYTDPLLYKKHRIEHKIKSNSGLCSICGKYVRTLKQHMQKCHTSECNFTCETCGKKFPVMAYLKKHQEKHNMEKCLCQICGKAYQFRTGLRMHIAMVHTNVSCEYCSKTMTAGEYKKHKLDCDKSWGLLCVEKKKKCIVAMTSEDEVSRDVVL